MERCGSMGSGMSGCWLRNALLLVGTAGLSWGQFKPAAPAQPPAEAPTYSVRVNLVRLLVSVRDATGALLTHLDKQDFRISDSGVPQEIALFERNTSLPLSVAILVDTSGSTQRDLRYEVGSVKRFIPALLGSRNPDDALALFTFNWRTNLELDYTRNAKRAQSALRFLRGEGGTSLYDTIYLASSTLLDREGRHVIIAVTDGGDTTSYKRYDEALAAAQRADAVLYPIVVVPIPGEAGRNTGGEHALETLASATGGRIFYPESFEQLDAAFADIIQELRTQYMLGFYPKAVREEPRRYHPVKVSSQDPTFKISSRNGYYEP